MKYLIFFTVSSIIAYFLFANYKKLFQKLYIIDRQNLNYAFKRTPSGSGIIFLLLFLCGNIFFYIFEENFKEIIPNRYYLFIISISLLSFISFLDDRKSIDPIFRLISQMILVYLSISCLKLSEIGLPDKLVFLLAVCSWIYIINITNFIDGSDGFLISNFIFYSLNIIFLGYYFKFDIFSYEIVKICMPFILVYFLFNKPKAKLFMGDAGSIFLGFLVGYFFLELLIMNKWNIALSLLSYNLLDCSYCLIKKMKRGIMPWIGIYDYFFLKPILKNKINHFNVFYLINIFWIINTLIIISQEYFKLQYLFILSILFSIVLLVIFENLEKKLNFLKIKK